MISASLVRSLRALLSVLLLAVALSVATTGPLAAQAQALAQSTAAGDSTSAEADSAAPPEGEAQPGAVEAAALLEILRDPQARDRLIHMLEAAGAEQGAEPGADASGQAAEPASETASQPASDGVVEEAAQVADEAVARSIGLGQHIAEVTRTAANSLADTLMKLWYEAASAPERLADLDDALDIDVISDSLKDLALIVVAAYAVLLLFRRAVGGLRRRMGEMGRTAGWLRSTWLGIGVALLDVVTVVAAWAAGYAIAGLAVGTIGEVGLRQSLFLNAFVVVEVARVIIRLLLRPDTGSLRILPFPDGAARYLTLRLGVAAAIFGYGQLLATPILMREASWRAGQALGTAIGLILVIWAFVIVVRRRREVADWLTPTDPGGRRYFAAAAKAWHIPVLIYLTALFLIVLTRPGNVLGPVLAASGKILVALAAGMLINHLLANWARRGVRVPGSLSESLPLLEARLNAFVPKLLLIVRLIVSLGILGIALDVAGIFSLSEWMSTELGLRLTAGVVSVFFILLGAFLVWLAFSAWVDWRLSPIVGKAPTARETTLLTLLRNAVTIALAVITLMFALSELGIDIAPLIASAGVLGLAIGFGAQKLVQDVITGVFIQLENAMNVGDVVTVGSTTGTVEKLTVRSVSVRTLDGTYHLIPFSSVDSVANLTRDFSYCVMDVGIAYREDIDESKTAILDAFQELKDSGDFSHALLGDAEWFGVNGLGDSAVMLRARAKTVPGAQWGLGRAWNERIKKIFDARGIEIPFPHQTIYFGENKDGTAPPMHVVRHPAPQKVEEAELLPTEEPTAEADGPETGKSLHRDMPDSD